jgi:predicted AlkP superfamily pyrophosphatase or phosphodiesterase
MKKLFLLIFAIVILEVSAGAPINVRKTAPSAVTLKPKLVLAIMVDQFRYDYLLRFRDSYHDGLELLLTKGAVFTNARYDHFPTVTSTGHATFLTGAYPAVSGIIGNEWYDRDSGRMIQSASDESVRLVGGAKGAGASPHNLLVSSIGDEMKMADQGRCRVVGISLKDYSGVLAAGHMANGVYWFDVKTGNFVSSSYYVAELPGWVNAFNAGRPAERFRGAEWLGTSLPEEPGPELYGMLQRTPFGNLLVEEMAEEAVKAEQLGRRSATDLLVLSFSSNDFIGHQYGPDSDQVRDVSVKTDQVLGKLFGFLESRVGMANVTVVFSADHGVAPVPEINAEHKMPGGRISFAAVADAVEKALTQKFGEGKWIVGAPEATIYLNRDLMKSRKLTEEEVEREAAQAALSLPHVFRVYTREQLLRGCPMEDSVGRRVMHGFSMRRGADVYVLPEPYYLAGAARTTHGTPFGYDTHVPVIFMGPGIKAGRFHECIAVNDVAPTLATLLGIEIPSGSEGRILSEIFARP